MELDFSRINKTPKNEFEAIELLVKSQSNLQQALHKMNQFFIDDCYDKDSIDTHKRIMMDFLKPFVKS